MWSQGFWWNTMQFGSVLNHHHCSCHTDMKPTSSRRVCHHHQSLATSLAWWGCRAELCNITINDIHPSNMWLASWPFPTGAYWFQFESLQGWMPWGMTYKMTIPTKVALHDNDMGWGLFHPGSHLFIGNVILPSDMFYHLQAMCIKGIKLLSQHQSQRPCL